MFFKNLGEGRDGSARSTETMCKNGSVQISCTKATKLTQSLLLKEIEGLVRIKRLWNQHYLHVHVIFQLMRDVNNGICYEKLSGAMIMYYTVLWLVCATVTALSQSTTYSSPPSLFPHTHPSIPSSPCRGTLSPPLLFHPLSLVLNKNEKNDVGIWGYLCSPLCCLHTAIHVCVVFGTAIPTSIYIHTCIWS